MLINRVANTDMTWHQEVTNAAPRVSPIVDLTLDDSPVLRAIDNLNFIQMKRKSNFIYFIIREYRKNMLFLHAAAKEGEERIPAGIIKNDFVCV